MRFPDSHGEGIVMPTPGGLPKPGEHWRLRKRLPKSGGQWETITIDMIVVERGTGSFWPLRVRDIHTGEVRLWVDASYDFSQGWLTYVPPNPDNAFREWLDKYTDDNGAPYALEHELKSAWEAGRNYEKK